MKVPTIERLRDCLAYDAETGALTWKKRSDPTAAIFNTRWPGKRAGTLRPDRYVAVKIDDAVLPAHRIAWAMVHGEWPQCVRHRNRNLADNRLANLYPATRKQIRAEWAR